MNNNDLEERLINFAVLIVEMTDVMSQSLAARQLSGQLLRSGTSPALNYGEALGSESKKDFIHKIGIVLKELRETFVCLKIIERARLCDTKEKTNQLLNESNELISIFVKTVTTARKNI